MDAGDEDGWPVTGENIIQVVLTIIIAVLVSVVIGVIVVVLVIVEWSEGVRRYHPSCHHDRLQCWILTITRNTNVPILTNIKLGVGWIHRRKQHRSHDRQECHSECNVTCAGGFLFVLRSNIIFNYQSILFPEC